MTHFPPLCFEVSCCWLLPMWADPSWCCWLGCPLGSWVAGANVQPILCVFHTLMPLSDPDVLQLEARIWVCVFPLLVYARGQRLAWYPVPGLSFDLLS